MHLLTVPHIENPAIVHIAEHDGLVDRIARLNVAVREDTEHVERERTDLIDAIGLDAVAVGLNHHILRHLNAVVGGQHMLDVHAVRAVSEELIELLLLPLVQGDIHHLEKEIRRFLVRIEISNVCDKLIEIYLCTANVLVFLRRHPLQRDAQCIQARINECVGKGGTQQGGIRDDLYALGNIFFLCDAHHIRNMRIEQRFPLSREREHLEFLRELCELFDGLFVRLHCHVLGREVILLLHLGKAKRMPAVGAFEVAERRRKDECAVRYRKREDGGELDAFRSIDWLDFGCHSPSPSLQRAAADVLHHHPAAPSDY